jgi:hypothetical protein
MLIFPKFKHLCVEEAAAHTTGGKFVLIYTAVRGACLYNDKKENDEFLRH